MMSSPKLRIALLAAATFGWTYEARATAVNIRVNASKDDADEDAGGSVSFTATSLRFTNSQLWAGCRFTNVSIPQGAYIISAYLTFTASNNDSDSASTTFYAEAVDDSSAFKNGTSNISSRGRTSDKVDWNSMPGWNTNSSYSSPDLRTIVQAIVNRSGWTSGNALSIIIQRNSGNRQAKSYNGSTTGAPLLNVEYVVITRPVANRLLFAVTSTASPTTKELQLKTFFQDIGYTVTLINASASQSAYDVAAAANDVAYISAAILATDVNTKLKSKPLGIVTEAPDLADDFAISTTYSSTSATAINIVKNNHYITSAFSNGSLTVTSSAQSMTTLSGTLAPDLNALATIAGAPSLVAVETNGKLYDGTTAVGRRVFLPWSNTAIDLPLLTDNGYLLLSRTLAWAGGLVAYWRLDEASGMTASDSSVNKTDGQLTFLSFSTSGVSTAKVDRGLTFDGSDDYVSVPSSSVFQLTKALSISAWIYGRSWGSGSYANVILRKGDNNPNNWQLAIENGYLALGLDGNDGSNVHGNTVLKTYRWHHVVGTWDGVKIRIYVDGSLDNTPTSRAAPINQDNRAVFLGGRINTTDIFKGIIDDVRFFNYALDADEVNVLKGQGRPFVILVRWEEIQ